MLDIHKCLTWLLQQHSACELTALQLACLPAQSVSTYVSKTVRQGTHALMLTWYDKAASGRADATGLLQMGKWSRAAATTESTTIIEILQQAIVHTASVTRRRPQTCCWDGHTSSSLLHMLQQKRAAAASSQDRIVQATNLLQPCLIFRVHHIGFEANT